MWACPHCQQPLHFSESRCAWTCAGNHQFDRARQGYVNLLSTNRRGSRDPGDSAEMLAARRRVHTADVYKPLAQGIVDLLGGGRQFESILDLGCGEGYYSGVLQQLAPGAQVQGVDIARAGVRMAAKHYPGIEFAVASAFQLPLLAASQDLVLRVFAPSEEGELGRVLRPGGYYLEVTPAARHMWELREALYDEPRESLPARESYAGLNIVETVELDYRVELGQSMLSDLVAMTPFAWRGHREKRQALLQSPGLSLQMAFSLRLFEKSTS